MGEMPVTYLILAVLVLFRLALVAMFVVLVGRVRGRHRARPWSAPCIRRTRDAYART